LGLFNASGRNKANRRNKANSFLENIEEYLAV
jgi:hypothetical protein